jgi:hypothetical protein
MPNSNGDFMLKWTLILCLIITVSCKKESEDFNPYTTGVELADEDTAKILYTYSTKNYTEDDISRELKFSKYRADMLRYNERINSIRAFYIRVEYMKEKGMSDYYGRKGIVPTLATIFKEDFEDRDIKKFYEKHKNTRFKDLDTKNNQNWLAEVRYHKMVDHITEMYLKKLNELTDSKKLQVNLLPPDIRKTGIDFDQFPRIGNKDSKYELIAVTNYFCEECRSGNKEIARLFKDYGKEFSYVHVGHTYRPGDVSMDTIVAGRCITKMDKTKYWKFQNYMFSNESFRKIKLSDKKKMRSVLSDAVTHLKLNKKEFFECMGDKDNTFDVSDSILFFRDLNISQVPAYFLNGRQLSYREFNSLIYAFREMDDRLKRLKISN